MLILLGVYWCLLLIIMLMLFAALRSNFWRVVFVYNVGDILGGGSANDLTALFFHLAEFL
jgi:hypothetical protein